MSPVHLVAVIAAGFVVAFLYGLGVKKADPTVALRQAYLLRRRYEGHPVPDVPTSPGEHARVFPDRYPHVPEEQILQLASRRRRGSTAS